MQNTVVIAGAGHAAGQTIVSLRQGGFAGRIVLVGEEPYLPYQRPPLSKKFLAGEMDVPRLLLRQEKFYAEHAVEVLLNTRVTRVEPGARTVDAVHRRPARLRQAGAGHRQPGARGQPAGQPPRPGSTTCAPSRTWTVSAIISTPAPRW